MNDTANTGPTSPVEDVLRNRINTSADQPPAVIDHSTPLSAQLDVAVDLSDELES